MRDRVRDRDRDRVRDRVRGRVRDRVSVRVRDRVRIAMRFRASAGTRGTVTGRAGVQEGGQWVGFGLGCWFGL